MKGFDHQMISIGIVLLFFTKANLYCHTSSLSIKHVDALELRSVWAPLLQAYYI